MRDKILEICNELFPRIDFANEKALIDDGILDSLSIIAIASELSLEFDVEFDLNELQPANMNSIDAIAETIKMLQNQ